MAGRGARRIRRSSVLRSADSPSLPPSRAPAAPPNASPIDVRQSSKRAVLRAQAGAMLGHFRRHIAQRYHVIKLTPALFDDLRED